MAASKKQSQSWLRSILPGSAVSLIVHAMILLIAGMSLKGCESGPPVEAGGQRFREIGIAVVPNQSTPADDSDSTDQDADAETPSETDAEVTPAELLPSPDDAPSVASLLDNTDSREDATKTSSELPAIIAPGAPNGGLPQTGGIPDIIRPRARSGIGAAGSPTPGPGETTFMNIVGTGQSFVYVIDISSSMGHGNRLALAKNQLMGSLRRLKPNQVFQVLFYHAMTTQMKLRDRAEEDLYPATPLHLQLAKAEIDRVTPTGGTVHLAPILHALRLEPDVVYFLTDGEQPGLSRSDLQTIRRHNRNGSQIHVVEFASGPRESRDISWLQVLAQQGGGKYSRIKVN